MVTAVALNCEAGEPTDDAAPGCMLDANSASSERSCDLCQERCPGRKGLRPPPRTGVSDPGKWAEFLPALGLPPCGQLRGNVLEDPGPPTRRVALLPTKGARHTLGACLSVQSHPLVSTAERGQRSLLMWFMPPTNSRDISHKRANWGHVGLKKCASVPLASLRAWPCRPRRCDVKCVGPTLSPGGPFASRTPQKPKTKLPQVPCSRTHDPV